MKNILFLAFLLVCFLGATPQSANAQGDWPALKEFHGVMSQTFHPMQEGNFKPIRERSMEMVKKAKAVAKSDIPEAYKNKEILMELKNLAKGSKKLHKLVKKDKPDEEVGKSLDDLHNVFHRIMGLCSDHEEGHEGHNHEGHNH